VTTSAPSSTSSGCPGQSSKTSCVSHPAGLPDLFIDRSRRSHGGSPALSGARGSVPQAPQLQTACLAPALRTTGLNYRFHDLRHSGLTWAAASGATVAELMHRGGHSTSATAMRYQHATRDRDQAIARALSNMTAGQGDHIVPASRTPRPGATGRAGSCSLGRGGAADGRSGSERRTRPARGGGRAVSPGRTALPEMGACGSRSGVGVLL
jgi:hypothetical protein